MNRNESWTIIGVSVAVIGLIIFVWLELSNKIDKNQQNMHDNHVEMIKEIHALEIKIIGQFSDLTSEIIYEVLGDK